MPTSYTDPVTGITIPTPEQQAGPLYATNISDALLALAHLKHTGVANEDGYQIPVAGFDWNDDLSAQSHNLTALRTTRFTSQGSPLNGVGDLNCLYVSNGEAWFNDSLGQQVKLTDNGVVNVTATNNWSTTSTSTNYTINSTDPYAVINYSSWSGNRILTLPAANTVTAGRFYFIKDLTGNANISTNTIAVTPSGADTIDGAASYTIRLSYGAILVISDGTSKWSIFAFTKPDTLQGTNVLISASADISMAASDDVTIEAADQMSLSGAAITLVGKILLPVKPVTSTPYTCDTSTMDCVIFVDTTSTAITINLPASTNGRTLFIQDVGGNAGTNNITLHRAAGENIQGIPSDYVMDGAYQGVTLVGYQGNSWFIVATS